MPDDLVAAYRRYIACLNDRDLDRLGLFVSDRLEYNGSPIGLDGYRELLEGNLADIPDLHFDVQLVVCDGELLASRLHFDCTPVGEFLGLDVDGRRVSFCENVIYSYVDDKIARVWSVVDKAAIEAQLAR